MREYGHGQSELALALGPELALALGRVRPGRARARSCDGSAPRGQAPQAWIGAAAGRPKPQDLTSSRLDLTRGACGSLDVSMGPLFAARVSYELDELRPSL
jgi:hypothetical protein